MRIDELHAASGKRALHLTLPAGKGADYRPRLTSTQAVPKSDGVLFVRLNLFLTQFEPNHAVLATALGAEESQYQFNVLGGNFLTPVWNKDHLGITNCAGRKCADPTRAQTGSSAP